MKAVILHSVPIHYKHLLFTSMKKLGLEFEVLYLASTLSIRQEQIPLNEDFYKCRIGFEGDYASAPALQRIAFTWRSLCDIKPDIVVASGYMVVESWAALVWTLLRRKHLIIWFESNQWDYPRHWYKELPKKIFVKCCSQAQVYGLSSADYMAKLGMPRSRIIGKRTVANTELFVVQPGEKSYFDGGLKRFIYVGRLAPEKNIGTLITAFAKVAAKVGGESLRLTIVGTGPLEKELKQLCEEHNVQQIVSFEGYKYQSELPALFKTSDFFVLPSIREPYGLVVLEAMLSRLPVILSRVCGCARDVLTPETGWEFSPFGESSLVEALETALAVDSDRMREMGDRCYEMARGFNPDYSAARVIEGFRKLATT